MGPARMCPQVGLVAPLPNMAGATVWGLWVTPLPSMARHYLGSGQQFGGTAGQQLACDLTT